MFWVVREKVKALPGNFVILRHHAKLYNITLKTTTLYIYLEKEVHSDEILDKAFVPLGDMFWR